MSDFFLLKDFFLPEQVLCDGLFKYTAGCAGYEVDNILCYAVNEKYLEVALSNPKVSSIIIPKVLAKLVDSTNKGIVVSNEVESDFIKINNHLCIERMMKMNFDFKIHSTAEIDSSSLIDSDVFIGKNVKIGKRCLIKNNTIIGDDCIIGDDVTIGNEGLYFKRDKDFKLLKVESSGAVFIDENVEILNGSMIQKSHDLGAFTRVGKGSKISVNVNIAHSSTIGEHSLISGNVQIAGRAKIGNYCWVGTSSTISDSIKIGDHAQVRIGSIVIQDVPERGDVSGNFAYVHRKNLKNFVDKVRN